MSAPQYIGENLYIRPDYICIIPEYYRSASKRPMQMEPRVKPPRDNSHKGKVSRKADKNIRNAVNWLVASAKKKRVYNEKFKKHFYFKINLLTLTLPDTSEVINERLFKSQLLHNFLATARNKWGMKNYIWKLEYQQNGKLHAHITTDTFIHHADLRKVWNRILQKNGFLSLFSSVFGHENPNSTDVHSVRNVDNLAAYLAKYLSKNSESKNKIKGRIWGSSYSLSANNKLTLSGIDWREIYTDTAKITDKAKWKPLTRKDKLTGLEYSFGWMLRLTLSDWKNKIVGNLRSAFDNHLFHIRNDVELIPFSYAN